MSQHDPEKRHRRDDMPAGFAVDPATGRLTPAGHQPTEAVPTAFGLDSRGTFLFSAGTASGRLASYRVDDGTGALKPLEIYAVGSQPASGAGGPSQP
jgi:6-phosphogluconolactonase